MDSSDAPGPGGRDEEGGLASERPPESEPEALGWSAVRVACLCQPSPNSGSLGDLGGQVQRLAEAHS